MDQSPNIIIHMKKSGFYYIYLCKSTYLGSTQHMTDFNVYTIYLVV